MKAVGMAFTLVLALTSSGSSVACGHCVEDRIAAVYDHALLQQTAARQQRIAYFALEGRFTRGDKERHQIRALVEATPGVNQGSTRVSLEPAALAIAFDPRRSSAESIETLLQKKLRAIKVSVLLLQSAPMRQ